MPIRLIPILQLSNGSLVKTKKFDKRVYIGDPVNTAKIFNELMVDELIVIDIDSTFMGTPINMECVKLLAEQCFMPVTYGGGISDMAAADQIFELGIEKISLNDVLLTNPAMVEELVKKYGSQAIVGSIDVRQNIFRGYDVYRRKGKQKIKKDFIEFLKYVEALGVGEILLSNISREGMWTGIDQKLTKLAASSVDVPVISAGGYAGLSEFEKINSIALCSGIGVGSAFVFQKKDFGVLVNYPNLDQFHGYTE